MKGDEIIRSITFLRDESRRETRAVGKNVFTLAADIMEREIPKNDSYDGTCHNCHERVKLTDHYCPHCGWKQPDTELWMTNNL